jgi:carboxymethylenebutenolidase
MLCSRRLVAILLLSIALCAPAAAQDWAKKKLESSPRHLEWVTVPSGDRKVETFVAYPENAEKATVVLVIHEIFGLSDWVKLQCDDLAAAGFIAVAPDMLSGSGQSGPIEDMEAARKAISLLPPEQVTADLNAVAAYAKDLKAGNGKLAVAGFCWGGTQTFRFATECDTMAACFPFYGSAPEDKAALAKISRPIYGFYAQNDARVNATLPATEQVLKALGKSFEPVIYAEAGHGFMRAGVAPDASAANAQAHKDAWKRWLDLLRKL